MTDEEIERFRSIFKDTRLEGQTIDSVEVQQTEDGFFVQLVSSKPHFFHACILFPFGGIVDKVIKG